MGRFTAVIARTWLNEQQYGWRFSPNINSFAKPYAYVKAMLYTAGADELRPQERNHIQGHVEVMMQEGDSELSNFIQGYQDSTRDSTVAQVLNNLSPPTPESTRIVVYDTLRAAIADGDYDQKEKINVHRVVRFLGIPDGVASKIEEIALKELQLSNRKAALLQKF